MILLGTLVLLSVAFGGLQLAGRSRRRRRNAELAARQSRENSATAELEARSQRATAIGRIDSSDWNDFAELSDGEDRQQWLFSQGVYSAAFGTSTDELPSQSELTLLDRTIAEEHFGGVSIDPLRSIRQSEQDRMAHYEDQRRERAELAEERRRSEATMRNVKRFWQGLSEAERREYRELTIDRERQRWISQRDGSELFYFHPVLAFSTLAALSEPRKPSSAMPVESRPSARRIHRLQPLKIAVRQKAKSPSRQNGRKIA